jgi:serine/threonine protein phosphatase PrpC
VFIVLDGHNGRVSVDFVAKRLPQLILESLEFQKNDFIGAMKIGFEQVEVELYHHLVMEEGGERLSSPLTSPHIAPDLQGLESPRISGNFPTMSVRRLNTFEAREALNRDFPKLTSGVVACVVLIVRGVIHTAHVGDCRTILCRRRPSQLFGGNEVVQLTTDHNVYNLVERNRVESLISPDGYVKGLMVTRSLGNYCLPKSGTDPLVKVEGQLSDASFSVTNIGDDDEFIVIASDGLYEVMSNDVVVDTVVKGMKRPSFAPSKSAQELVDRAISRGSSDNVCVCLVILSHFRN